MSGMSSYFFRSCCSAVISRQAHKKRLIAQIWAQIMGLDTTIKIQYTAVPAAFVKATEKMFRMIASSVALREMSDKFRMQRSVCFSCVLIARYKIIVGGTKNSREKNISTQ